MKLHRVLAAVLTAFPLLVGSASAQEKADWSWYEVNEKKEVRVNLYLFWSSTCPHCPPAVEFVDWLSKRYTWVNVYKYEISGTPANRALYQRMTASLNRIGGQTPAFFYCKTMEMGYVSYEQTGKRIEQNLVRWYEALHKHFNPGNASAAKVLMVTLLLGGGPPELDPGFPDLPVDLPPAEEKFHLPGWGEVEASTVSLPAVTLVLAACDSFNPCAFFVLLLLLSMLVHGRSRFRMVLVGGTFVAFSGIMYFLFMAAWLNLFFVVGHLQIITIAAGLIAAIVGVLNVKDYFWFKRGPSLSIPESAKPGLFQRMARLINVTSLPSLLIGSAGLAILANLYELLCTSGFPMVYTRILTLRELPTAQYYGFLALYNLIYVAPMALIVFVFVLTLGARKLTEFQGRILKLLSGVMMLALAVTLLFWQEVLRSAIGAFSILLVSVAVTAVIALWEYRRRDGSAVPKKSVPPRDLVMTP